MIRTLGSGVVWKVLNMSVLFPADISPDITSAVKPSLARCSRTRSIAFLKGTNTNTLLLVSVIISDNTFSRDDASKFTLSLESVYTVPHAIWSSLFIRTAALTALISSSAAETMLWTSILL